MIIDRPKSEYSILSKHLRDLREEYFLNPSRELKDKIHKLDTKLKKINSGLVRFTTPHGNYKEFCEYQSSSFKK